MNDFVGDAALGVPKQFFDKLRGARKAPLFFWLFYVNTFVGDGVPDVPDSVLWHSEGTAADRCSLLFYAEEILEVVSENELIFLGSESQSEEALQLLFMAPHREIRTEEAILHTIGAHHMSSLFRSEKCQ